MKENKLLNVKSLKRWDCVITEETMYYFKIKVQKCLPQMCCSLPQYFREFQNLVRTLYT